MNFLVTHFKNGTYFSLLSYLNCESLVAQLCPTVFDPMDYSLQAPLPRNSPGNNTGVGSHFLLQGILPTQGSNPGLPHCRWILCQLSHREAQEYWSGWPIPSPRDLSHPGIKQGSPASQEDSLPTELSGNPNASSSRCHISPELLQLVPDILFAPYLFPTSSFFTESFSDHIKI